MKNSVVGVECPQTSLVSDLDLGNVLLFPIDDKQSRLDGQDQVESVQTKPMQHKGTKKKC